MPMEMFKYPFIRLGLVGLKGSGKTDFISTALSELGCNNSTQTLYQNLGKLKLEIQGENFSGFWKIADSRRTYGLGVYEFSDEKNSGKYANIFNAILFTIDFATDDERAVVATLKELTKLIVGSDKRGDSIINLPPLAVIITKFDKIIYEPELRSEFGIHSIAMMPATQIRDGKLNLSEVREVSNEVKHFLEDNGWENLVKIVQANFTKHMFFVTSVNVSQITSGDTMPHRVLDPLLWSLQSRVK